MAKIGQGITVHDKMQRDYRYKISAPVGQYFDPDFDPYFTRQEMLAHGVFEGKYLNDCRDEFPAS